jgi:hypothetical protein
VTAADEEDDRAKRWVDVSETLKTSRVTWLSHPTVRISHTLGLEKRDPCPVSHIDLRAQHPDDDLVI